MVVVSPFLDKHHGTERVVAEQLERLCNTYEIHLYSGRVEDVSLDNIQWHRVFVPRGPYLLSYVFWLVANHFYRLRDRWFRGVTPDIVYSPGVNCIDADVVAVHIVFAEFREQVRKQLKLGGNPIKAWPTLIHRRIYYLLCEYLERYIYNNDRVVLCAVSEKTAQAIAKHCGRREPVKVVYNGLDTDKFNPERCRQMRPFSREALRIPRGAFAILLIGNDWKKKGLPCLLQAVGRLQDPNLRVLVAGHDTASHYQDTIESLRIVEQVLFLPLRPDVEFYYAAADVYAGPSLDDSFALPPVESMACGLPVITTRLNGGCAIMHHGVDGLILQDPCDFQTLSEWLVRLANDPAWRSQLGAAAACTAKQYTWERNVMEMRSVFDDARRVRGST